MTKVSVTSNFWLKLTDVKRYCRKVGHLSKFLFYFIILSNKRHLRELLIYFLNLNKSAADASDSSNHRLFVETYSEAALSERSCRELFQKLENGEFDIEDKERSGRPKAYEDAELEAL